MTAAASPTPTRRRRPRLPGPWNRSLQARLVLYFLLLSLVSVSVVGLAVYQRATLDLERSAFERLEAVADARATAFDRWVENQRQAIAYIGGIPGLADDARTFMDGEALPSERDAAAGRLTLTLDTAVPRIAAAESIDVVDDAGMVRFSTNHERVDMDVSDEAWFADRLDDTTVVDPHLSPMTGRPVITVATPLADGPARDTEAVVLAADLDFRQLDALILDDTGLGLGGAVYLMGADNRFLHPRLLARVRDDETFTSTGIERALAGQSGEATYEDFSGEPVIGTYRWLDTYGVALIVELSQAVAFAPAQELLLLIALIGVLTVVLLTSGVWIIARQVSRPLGGLARTATDVAGGDLSVTAPVTSEDEVGRLAAAFNAMTAQLRENVETLEGRVEARTAELTAALAAQRAAENQYRGLIEQLPMAVYAGAADETTAMAYVSPRITELVGYPPERWSDPGFLETILVPEDRDRALREISLDRLMAEGQTSSTYRLISSTGGLVWVQDDKWLARDEDGEAVEIQGVLSDVTQRTIDESELTRQKLYFESLVEASPVAVLTVVGESQMVVAWNPGATRLFGWSLDEAIGRSIDDLIVLDDEKRAESAAVTREASETGRGTRMTQRHRKDGSAVDVELIVVPLMINGEEVASLAIYHDISELVAARAAADAANEAKSSFLAAMSHEIRTPMNAIIGMSGLLADTALGDEQRDYVDTIRTSGDALLLIINDILDFSKIEAGHTELDDAPFSLRGCLEGAIDVLAPTAADKGIELAYDIDEALPRTVSGDEGRVRQIVLNLLSNAVMFTLEGEVELRASGSQRDGDDGVWDLVVSVRDTGIGIPEEKMGRLFRSFSQADDSISRRFGGTGLGLAISHRLAELMDGSLTAESAGIEGQGSTFTFQARLVAAADESVGQLAGAETDLAGRTVLIVDDNATNRRILTAQVGRWGMEPRDTESASVALGWIEEGAAVDLVLTDLHMPGLDGLGLAAAVRTSRPGVPVVVLSSMGHRDHGDAPVEAYLTKPVKPSALHDTIQNVLAGAPTSSARREPRRLTLDPDMAVAHPLRILLAEDNLVNQKLALKLLERMGYAADVVGDGAAAVASVDRDDYDVVLMDVQMPELDGLEATRRIRATHPDSGPRIVAMTANAMAEDREACLAAGMDDYISKPIRTDALVEALWQVPAAEGGT